MLRFIIPAYNEEKNIGVLVENTRKFVQREKHEYQIIVVNDGSTDKTVQILDELKKKAPIVILDQGSNKGVGEAFRTGFKYAAEVAEEGDIIISKEADNTSDLAILGGMINKITEGYDLVLASCYMPGGEVTNTSISRRILSVGANFLLKMTTPLKGVHTFSSFYRAYRANLIKEAYGIYGEKLIEEKGFSCMVELLIKLANLDIKITEVPMTLKGDMRKGRSKMKILDTTISYIKLIFKNTLMGGRRKL